MENELKIGDWVTFTDKYGDRLQGSIAEIAGPILYADCFVPRWKMEVRCMVGIKAVKKIQKPETK